MKRFILFFSSLWILSGLGIVSSAAAQTSETPDQLVQRVANEVIEVIRSDPKVQAGDPTRVRELLDGKLLPYFDFRRMTILAMGRNWREASSEQQTQLVEEFKNLLIRTYSNALSQYRDDTINVKPLRAREGDKEVTVRSEVTRKGEAPVPVDYSMVLDKDGKWRCYDVIVGGVSLVTNYRDEFNQQVRTGGVDGLIQSIEHKNRGAATTPAQQ